MAKHDYSSTQLNLPDGMASMVRAFGQVIPDSELSSKGRESCVHVTCKYGLVTDDWQEVQDHVRGFGPVHMTLGDVGVFESNQTTDGEQHDVVYVGVLSQDLHELNERLSRMPHVDTHQDYCPHVTVAYLKPGCGRKYAGFTDLSGLQARFMTLEFSSKDGKQHEIELGASGQKSMDVFHKAGYSDSEPRDDDGKWTAGAGGGGEKEPTGDKTPSKPKAQATTRSTEDVYQGIVEGRTSFQDINTHISELSKLSKDEIHKLAPTLGVHPSKGDSKANVLERMASSMKGRLTARSRTSYGSEHLAGPASSAASKEPSTGDKTSPTAETKETAQPAPKMEQVHGKRDELSSKLEASRVGVNSGASENHGHQPGVGWKLHLSTADIDGVSDKLKEMGLKHKVGRSDNQEGKDITVYVGHKDEARDAAKKIQLGVGHLLRDVHGDPLKTNEKFTQKVSGRFDVGHEKVGADFHQYGTGGIPHLNQDIDPFQEKKPGAFDRAHKKLTEIYGEFYTGKKQGGPEWIQSQKQAKQPHEGIKDTYDNFKDIDYANIDSTVKQHLAGLNPEQAKQAYKQAFGHDPMANSASGIAKEIVQRISERKESWDRIQFRSDDGRNSINKALLSEAGLALWEEISKAGYRADQARGPDGRWTAGGGGGGSAKEKPDAKSKVKQPKSEIKDKTNPDSATTKQKPKGEPSSPAPEAKQSPEAPKMQQVHQKRDEISKKLESSRLNPDSAQRPASVRSPESVSKATELLEGAKTAHTEKYSSTTSESQIKKTFKNEEAKLRKAGKFDRVTQQKMKADMDKQLGEVHDARKAAAEGHAKAISDYAEHLKQMHPEDLKEFTKQNGLRGRTAETLAKEAYIAAQDRSRWQQECRKNGISVAHFKAAAKEIRGVHNESVYYYNSMIDEAAGEGYMAKVRAIHNAGGDYTRLKGDRFDELAEHMASKEEYAMYFGGGINYAESASHETSGASKDHEQKLFEYLVAGKQKPMSKEESFSRAFDRLMDMKESGEYQRVRKRESKDWVPWEDF